MSFHEQIKAIRGERKLTQTQAAKLCAVTLRCYQRWESGKQPHILMQEAALIRLGASKPPEKASTTPVRITPSSNEKSSHPSFPRLISPANAPTAVPQIRAPLLKPSGKIV